MKTVRISQQVNAVTIPVKDIKALRKFYHEVLGWAILTENEKVVMFKLEQLVLTLCTFEIFTDYSGTSPADGTGKGFYLTINLDSPKRVDESFKRLSTTEVNITKMPKKAFWGGYSGFFTDPEGNIWEVCYNPISGTKV